MKTTITDQQIENAAILAAASYNNPFDEPAYDKRFYDGFIDGAHFALTHQWISADEQLPDSDDHVLVFIPSELATGYPDRFEVAYFDGEDWYAAVGEHIRPLFWMQIPQFNKENEEE